MTVIRVTDCVLRRLGPRGIYFVDKIQVKGSDWFIGGFQFRSVIYIEGLKLQARRLRSHVTGPMTDPGLCHSAGRRTGSNDKLTIRNRDTEKICLNCVLAPMPAVGNSWEKRRRTMLCIRPSCLTCVSQYPIAPPHSCDDHIVPQKNFAIL